jgi:hypothetical protein
MSSLGWFLFCYAYISFGEHFIHKYFMHRKILPESIYQRYPYVLEVFKAHGVRHHTQWYREFDYEPDPVGREENLPIPMKESVLMLIAGSPLWAPIFFFSVQGGLIFLATAILHNRLWSILHRQMHIPEDVFFRDWAVYRFIAMNHFLHHQDTRRHFNVAFPFADFVMGVTTKPRRADIREMMRLGYVKPRSDAGKHWVARRREVVESRRAPRLAPCPT